jgi:hopene-associated glycosyltransferase HpnB
MIGPWESVTVAALAAWSYLAFGRGGFWRSTERLPPAADENDRWPDVVAIMPARNEADVIGRSIGSILAQEYPGILTVVVVDDGSDDGTAEAVRATAAASEGRVDVVAGMTLPFGWVGKMWAVAQGVRHADRFAPRAEYIWLTDADILHATDELRRLVAKARTEGRDLVSLMVMLHCRSAFERLLIPAFVFFFQMLYPFPWVGDRDRRTAAAAGGSMLVRRSALSRIGGIESIRSELIDDCALAGRIKPGGAVWIGLTETTRSLRPYNGLTAIWQMVARTAFRQLGYSWALLALTVFGLTVVYAVPPIAILATPLHGSVIALSAAALAYAIMVRIYAPTLRLYGIRTAGSLLLPAAAVLYALMTLDSARRHIQGKGGGWKARHYSPDSGSTA